MGKVILWELHKPEYVLENETHKILRDFEMQMNHPILSRKSNLLLINKNN